MSKAKRTPKPPKGEPAQKRKSAKIDLIGWNEITVALDALKPYERNPRVISEEQYDKLKQSIIEDGYRTRIAATADLRIIGGHQRIRVLRELGFDKIQILVPDRKVTDAQFRRMLVRDNLFYADFDFDIMAADFTTEELTGYGVPEDWLLPKDDETEVKFNAKKKDKKVKCPHCGKKFIPEKAAK